MISPAFLAGKDLNALALPAWRQGRIEFKLESTMETPKIYLNSKKKNVIIKLNSSGALPINCKGITEYSNCLILFVFLYFFSKTFLLFIHRA